MRCFTLFCENITRYTTDPTSGTGLFKVSRCFFKSARDLGRSKPSTASYIIIVIIIIIGTTALCGSWPPLELS
jgi:hypothetical protein